MNFAITKKNIFIWLILIYIIPIILSVVMLSQGDEKNAVLMAIIIGIVWLIAIIITFLMLNEVKNNPYPFSYLVDYETLIRYMREEEKFSFDNNLEAGFHYYLYRGDKKVEIQSWHYIFSNFDSEKIKGNVYYWNKEEFDSLESLIENRIDKFNDYTLIELIDSDNAMLNEYKKNHKDLDINKYMKNLNK